MRAFRHPNFAYDGTQSEDYGTNAWFFLLRRRLSSNTISDSGDQLPVHLKPTSVPPDDSLGSDDDEGLFRLRPEAASENPEKLVAGSKSGLRMLALEDGQLLPKR